VIVLIKERTKNSVLQCTYIVCILLHTRKGYTKGMSRIHNIPLVCGQERKQNYIFYSYIKKGGEYNGMEYDN
jgi:hypothetical protein